MGRLRCTSSTCVLTCLAAMREITGPNATVGSLLITTDRHCCVQALSRAA